MELFVTSDLHFQHNNIIKYCNRPFADKEEMNEYLIQEINSKVKEGDEVIHAGDFMYGTDKAKHFFDVFERLNGNWRFVLGNHDRRTLEKWKDVLLRDHPRIHEIEFLKRMVHKNKLIIISHYEMKTWEHKEWRRKSNFRYAGVYHLFGHYHNNSAAVFDKDTLDIGIDASDYKLLTMDQQLDRIKK